MELNESNFAGRITCLQVGTPDEMQGVTHRSIRESQWLTTGTDQPSHGTMPLMLPMVETQERRSTPATGKAARPILDVENRDAAADQPKREPSSGNAHCLWCGRAFRRV